MHKISRRLFLKYSAGAMLGYTVQAREGGISETDAGRKQMGQSDLYISIDNEKIERDARRSLLGEGLIFGLSYMWDEKNQCMWPRLMAMLKELDADFFGHLGGPGMWVHDYHWKNCIGPMEKRRDPTPRLHVFDDVNGKAGTHEYGLMLEEYRNAMGRDALGSIQVNIMTGTAGDAADWVEYMNGSSHTRWGAIRSENGHREPFNVQYWELGNQPHFTFANMGRLTGVEYAERVREFTTAMKERDPTIKVAAYMPFFAFDSTVAEAIKLGSAIDGIPGKPGSDGPTWTELVLRESGNIIDALGFHWYGAANSRVHSHEYIMSSAYKGLLPNIERARRVVAEFAPSDESRERLGRFVCPEYGGISGNSPIGETATAIYGSVANSRLLHLFFSRDDILYAARFGLFAPYPEPKMIREMRTAYVAIHGRLDGSDFLGTAAYEMKRLWAKAYQPKVMSVDIDRCPCFSTGIPVLDATALGSGDGKALNLVLTNTSQKALLPKVSLNGFRSKPIAERLLVCGDLNDDNRWDDRSNVLLQTEEFSVGNEFKIKLPPNSINAVLMKGDK